MVEKTPSSSTAGTPFVCVCAARRLGCDSSMARRPYCASSADLSKQGSTLSLGRGVCETKSKKGRARDRKPFLHRVTALRGGLRPSSRKGPDHGVGVDASLLMIQSVTSQCRKPVIYHAHAHQKPPRPKCSPQKKPLADLCFPLCATGAKSRKIRIRQKEGSATSIEIGGQSRSRM